MYQQSLTCWAGGQPGYCGPNAIVGPNNNFNFSYGSTYVYQEQQASAIFNGIGASGLRINGYNFGFTAKNGNGWDDGRVDQLTALVRFWDTTGSKGTSNLLYGNSYDLNYKFNWTTFNYSETFATPLNVSSVGKVQYGFIGRDNNFWAGPYGPEVTNINFSLKYSVDTCSVDPRSSPSCPGYVSSVMSLVPASTSPSSTATVVAEQQAAAMSSEPSSSTSTAAPVAEQPVQQTQSTPATVATTTSSSPSVTVTVTASPVAVASASSTQEKKSTNGTSIGLSVIAKNKEREDAISTQAVSAAVSQAGNASQQAQDQAVSVAATQAQQSVAVTDSIASMTTSLYSIAPQQSLSNVGLSVQQNIQQSSAQQQGVQASSGTAMGLASASEVMQTQSIFKQQDTTTFGAQTTESTQVQSNMLLDKTNPINMILDALPLNVETNKQQTTSNVKKDVQPNEVAGGVDITSISVIPQNYNAYLNFVMQDAAFYAVRDIYPKQVNVDNARALRQLSSDRLHQEMVNQQYRK